MTFDLLQEHLLTDGVIRSHEAFCICRNCNRSTTFILRERQDADLLYLKLNGLLDLDGSVNDYVELDGYVNTTNFISIKPPEHSPHKVAEAFIEGAKCLSINCPNAAATMFRLCLDIATRELLPEEAREGLTVKVRRDLGLRLPWLFNANLLPEGLHDLSSCVKEDGNDGAHQGTLTMSDAEDLLDFTVALLERLFTEPIRLRQAEERRMTRRGQPSTLPAS